MAVFVCVMVIIGQAFLDMVTTLAKTLEKSLGA